MSYSTVRLFAAGSAMRIFIFMEDDIKLYIIKPFEELF